MGVDRSMQASIRVMPCCYITGQAAGTAAALAVKNGSSSHALDVKALQTALKQAGAFLPNC